MRPPVVLAPSQRTIDAVCAAVPHRVWQSLCALPVSVDAEGRVEVIVGVLPAAVAEGVLRPLLGYEVVATPSSVSAVVNGWQERGAPIAVDGHVPATVHGAWTMHRLGLVDNEAMTKAVLIQARTGEDLAGILLAEETVTQSTVTAVLAHEYGVAQVELAADDVDLDIARRVPEPVSRSTGAVAVRLVAGRLYVATQWPLAAEHEAALLAAVPEAASISQCLVTPRALDRARQRAYSDIYEHAALLKLAEERPEDSAKPVVTGPQKAALLVVLAVVLVAAVLRPASTSVALVGGASLLYLAVSLYRFQLTLRAFARPLGTEITDEELAALDESTLPVYTILIPLYREAAVVPRLVAGIHHLDYPQTKLDVLLLCEEDDDETIQVIESLDLPPQFRLVVVPDSQPKTKPKACNYGLALADGDYTVIYDAEDRPDPRQLKRALIAFATAPPEIACIQAKLAYYNGSQNLLTSWFANEYAMHYELLLPALDAAGDPIPLGGTSNHFRTEILRDIGGWDPYNVTEDADLGIRLARQGYRTEIVNSITWEEANSQLANWIRQRSRWIKGYMQTWLVHMRNPLKTFVQLGPAGFLSFNLNVGGAFVHLMNPLFWALTSLWLLGRFGWIEGLFPGFVYYAAAAMLFVGNFVFVYLSLAGSLRREQFELTRHALLSPLYWGLMAWAAWKAFAQLLTNPFYWEKTEHGLSDHVDPGAAVRPVPTGVGA